MGSVKGKNVILQLALSNDIDTLHEAGYKSMDTAADLVKKATDLYTDASAKFKEAQAKSDQAIAMTKELGVDSKSFDMKKANAKNAQAKADKNASITVLR